MEKELLYKEEVYQIIGAAIEVHQELGSGFLESVYEECMTIESKKRQIPHETQVGIPVYYHGINLPESSLPTISGMVKLLLSLSVYRN